ncbi:papilin-like [Ixodes scapularis]|uniref:papilin-like n=1 Tax=Ixodes scapularis TaxID=6945 RepID=UPI001A9FABBA|nr:papilin-like [Ixodes scapularis]
MKIIVLAMCFAVGSVFSSDDVTRKDDVPWTVRCLADIGNCTFPEVNLTWHFNNLKKDCDPGPVCPTSINYFTSSTECKKACLKVEEMCSCIRPQEQCKSDSTLFWAWNYNGVNCTRNQHCVRTIFDFTNEKQCRALCMKEQYKTDCTDELKREFEVTSKCPNNYEQRYYFNRNRKMCRWFVYDTCDENGTPDDPENSDNGNNFLSKHECDAACISSQKTTL